MRAPSPADNVEAVRRFNRFYTQRIGVLHEGLLGSEFSLAEARVLYELARRERPTASELVRDLGLDPSYLSRILQSFETQGLLRRSPATDDARRRLLTLTARGRKAFAPLDARSRAEIGAMLAPLANSEQNRLIDAMDAIESALAGSSAENPPYRLRPHVPGDIGWVVSRHGALYAQEYGWDLTFEALVAEIAARFLRHFDPRCENCWIAERHGANVGSAFVVKQAKTIAKLRLLLVEPSARGLGIGRALVAECIGFARTAGYRKLVLWTNDILHAARHLYVEAGFVLVKEERHQSFGHDLAGQNWELDLG
jgi:DNA-binding MarR family transcriptional regulator/N-acetylglutamate synthase-like GNAT family acetyltransferase